MTPEPMRPHEDARATDTDDREPEWRWAGVITFAAIAGTLAALLFHGPTRALPMPPAYALPYLAVMPGDEEGNP